MNIEKLVSTHNRLINAVCTSKWIQGSIAVRTIEQPNNVNNLITTSTKSVQHEKMNQRKCKL